MKKTVKQLFIVTRKPVSNNGGWAIMSAMIAIFVGLIMMAGIFGIVQISMDGSKTQEAQNNVTMIRTSVRQLFAGQPDYTGLTTVLARQAGMLPASMVTAGNNVINAWSGAVTVAEGTTADVFEITYAGVPDEDCIKLAPFGYGTWRSVDVGGAAIAQTGGGAVADAVAACTGGVNTITFESD